MLLGPRPHFAGSQSGWLNLMLSGFVLPCLVWCALEYICWVGSAVREGEKGAGPTSKASFTPNHALPPSPAPPGCSRMQDDPKVTLYYTQDPALSPFSDFSHSSFGTIPREASFGLTFAFPLAAQLLAKYAKYALPVHHPPTKSISKAEKQPLLLAYEINGCVRHYFPARSIVFGFLLEHLPEEERKRAQREVNKRGLWSHFEASFASVQGKLEPNVVYELAVLGMIVWKWEAAECESFSCSPTHTASVCSSSPNRQPLHFPPLYADERREFAVDLANMSWSG